MFIIECLPFARGLNKEILSYFGPKYIESGSLIKINLHNKIIPALVLSSKNAIEAKAEVKSANFQLKKISSVIVKPFLQKEFLEAVEITAKYFSTTQGEILYHLIPSSVLKNFKSLPKSIISKKISKPANILNTKSEVSILQTSEDERISLYRSLIREEFARKKSVFICLSQNEDMRQMKILLSRGIESFVCSFNSEMNKKELVEEWKKACQATHPVLIIANAKWLFLPREDMGVLVVEKEGEDSWKTFSRPFIDQRFFIETLANKMNIKLIIGDTLLRTETLYRYKQGEISEFESVKWRLPKNVETKIVDLKETTKKEKEFKTISENLLELIKENAEKKSNMFIFASRKGISSVVVCRDCGEQVKCNNCYSPMILYKKNDGGALKCHQCGETRDAAEICRHCHGWKLAAFGSGIDRVSEELKRNFPNLKIFEMHSDIISTSAKARDVAKNFYEDRGSVLLGTEMAFPYLYKKIWASSIASFDSLFSIPDFRIREKIFRIILQTRDLARDRFLIQTRNPEDPIIELANAGNLVDFYKKEIGDRQVLGYPPFGIFIKITVRGNKNFVAKETENLENALKSFDPVIFASIHEKKGEQAAVNAVIKIPKEKYPDPVLISVIRSLPVHFEVKVDPDNLL